LPEGSVLRIFELLGFIFISIRQKHLGGTGHACIPITVMKEGMTNKEFDNAIAA